MAMQVKPTVEPFSPATDDDYKYLSRDDIIEHGVLVQGKLGVSDDDNSSNAELGDDDDDEFLQEYRRKRLEELDAAVKKTDSQVKIANGTYDMIRGSDFVKEVTEASEQVWVVCHLRKDSVPDCGILDACLEVLAERYKGVTKFVKIVSTDCIPGYPDAHLPTMLLYHGKKCVKTLVGLGAVGGQGTSPDRVALTLNQFGSVCGDPGEERDAQIKGLVREMLDRHSIYDSDESS
jgi:hypothetical protein